MARASRTGVRGLYRAGDGSFAIDLRWRDPKTGEPLRHRERLPTGTASTTAKRRARLILNAVLTGERVSPA